MLALGNCAVSVSIDRIQSMKVADVVFREDLYPRLQTSAVTVQKYADDLSVLPPIDINQYCELIDGWHRWTAHKKAGAETILVVVTETKSDAEVLELAIERNATHGLQLSQEDKRNMARSIYNATPEREREAKKLYLAKILSVSERSVRDWLSRIDKDAKEARDKRIFELWLACWTQEEIAADVGLSGQMINVIVTDKDLPINGGFAESGKIQAQSEHATDFQIPLYNVWKQQEKTN
jgi:ParB-like chromosome segregation protein Spo0J